jgi:hypothetical protein
LDTETAVRSELHQFVDTLPDSAAKALLEYARWLAVREGEKAEHRDGRMPEAARENPQSLEELLNELLGDGERTESQTGA